MLPKDDDWILAARNHHEDLHFSTYYLRQSSSFFRDERSAWRGYDAIHAVFQDLTEEYFLSRQECQSHGTQLLRQFLQAPDSLPRLLTQIDGLSQRLESTVLLSGGRDDIGKTSRQELVALYREQRRAQDTLYNIARIPEALDRGVPTFTLYLQRYVAERSGLDESSVDLQVIFAQLVAPRRDSVVALEAEDLRRIARLSPTAHVNSIEELRHSQFEALRRHRAKWGFLHYHGYGSRALPSLTSYFRRLKLLASATGATEGVRSRSAVEASKAELISRLGIDFAHETLLRQYSEIGLVKLRRRFAQLAGFYYLDQIIARCSELSGIDEPLLRSLLPEELEETIIQELPIPLADLTDRAKLCVYSITKDGEQIVTGEKALELQSRLRDALMLASVEDEELRGQVACLGHATGIVRFVDRLTNTELQRFRPGDILASQATDPDLVPLISTAGAVITEDGGVTCHAAIICREFNTPAIVGVRNLTAHLRTGDEVDVDAFRGVVRVLRPVANRT